MSRAAGIPTIIVQRLRAGITIDGNVRKPEWRAIPPARFGHTTGDDAEPAPATTLRIGYTDSHLYIAFECEDADIWGTLTDRYDPIYDEEVVENFLCPTGDVRRYYEINVSPRNVLFDAIVEN